jgi:predicted metalloprotease with PDZ domain
MHDLSKTYGKDRAFKDEELFDQIVKLTYPEIGEFFKKHVEGSEPLPLEETLALAGVGFGAEPKEKEFTLGGVAIGLNAATNRLIIVNTPKMDDFGKAMGYLEYDEIIKFNGRKLTLENAQDVLTDYFSNVKENDILKVVVLRRKSETSRAKKVKLSSKVFKVIPSKRSNLTLFPDATAAQLKVRSAWIGKH